MSIENLFSTLVLTNDPLMDRVSNDSGLSRPYVLSEVRRLDRFLRGLPVRGRLAISYRVLIGLQCCYRSMSAEMQTIFRCGAFMGQWVNRGDGDISRPSVITTEERVWLNNFISHEIRENHRI